MGDTGILGYFVARETHKVKATLIQSVMCVLVGSILHLGVAFAFRQTCGSRLSLGLYAVPMLEFFVIVQLMVQAILYFRAE